MGFFLIGYLLTAALLWKQTVIPVYLLTGLVFLIGALFVLRTVAAGYDSINSLERLVAERTVDLEEARIEAEKAVRARTRFMANISHEIRTPMNAVIGMTTLLLESELNEQQKADVSTLREAGDVLLRVVTDVLDFAKMESDSFELDNQAFSLKELLESTVNIWSSNAQEKGIELRREPSLDLWPFWHGDRTRLQQILHNLVANAIRFTDRGSVTILAETTTDRVTLRVRDTGVGIAKEDHEQIFHSFRQSSTDRGGTGLGLAICHRLALAMEGDLRVESEPGKGCTFTLELPLGRAEGLEASPLSSGDIQGFSYRILLADDNEVNLKVARRFLEKLGCEVVTVDNGKEAVEQANHNRFDLILMDCQMPIMTGQEATREIRKAEKEYKNTIYALTAMATPGELQACIDGGMDGCITKPVRLSRLKNLLASLSHFHHEPDNREDIERNLS